MADIHSRLQENVLGPYFVDSSCIDCDTCRCIAPAHFSRQKDKGYSYVSRQPEIGREEELVEEAMDCCPVSAIGKIED